MMLAVICVILGEKISSSSIKWKNTLDENFDLVIETLDSPKLLPPGYSIVTEVL